VTPPKDPEAIEILAKAFGDSGYELKPVLSVLFNSEFFKNARFAKIKSPIEAVVGAARFAGGAEFPAPGIGNLASQSGQAVWLHGPRAAESARRGGLAHGC